MKYAIGLVINRPYSFFKTTEIRIVCTLYYEAMLAYASARNGGKERVIFMAKTFEIGHVVATKRVWEFIDEDQQFKNFVSGCLSRYILYDWGDTCPEDWMANNKAARHGERVLAVYNIPENLESGFEERLWIITERDRSITTLLFPSDC